MRTGAFAVPVKVWAVLCTIVGISLTADTLHTCVLAVLAFGFLMSERRWKLVLSFGAFYAALALLLYFIRFHGLHMVLFSEFYVLMFYRLMPVFLTAWNLITTLRGSFRQFCQGSCAFIGDSGVVGGVPIFSYNEVRVERTVSVYEKQAFDRSSADFEASSG